MTLNFSLMPGDIALGVLWLIALAITVLMVFELVGMRLMVQYFPEGRRPWMFPSQVAAMMAFAAVVHFNPF